MSINFNKTGKDFWVISTLSVRSINCFGEFNLSGNNLPHFQKNRKEPQNKTNRYVHPFNDMGLSKEKIQTTWFLSYSIVI